MAYVSSEENILIKSWDENFRTRHDHPYFELAYVTKGKAEHNFDNEKTTIKEGDFVIIDLETFHSYKALSKDEFHVTNCLFMPAFIDNSLSGCKHFSEILTFYQFRLAYNMLKQNPCNRILKDENGKIYSILKHMQEEYEKKEVGYLEIMRCSLIQIIIQIMRIVGAYDKIPTHHLVSKTVSKMVTQRYNESLTLSQIAKKLNYSLPYTSKKFSEEAGMSFRDYLISYRISQARILLANTSENIDEIAQKVGYNDTKLFFSHFKRITGTTPYQFRKIISN